MVLTEEQLKSIISNAANKTVSKMRNFSNGVVSKPKDAADKARHGWWDWSEGRPYKEGKPESLIDVIDSDGWKVRRIGKGIFRCVPKVFGAAANPLSFEDLVEDINTYLEDTGATHRCVGEETDRAYIIRLQ